MVLSSFISFAYSLLQRIIVQLLVPLYWQLNESCFYIVLIFNKYLHVHTDDIYFCNCIYNYTVDILMCTMNSGDTFIALVCICLKHSEVTEKSGSYHWALLLSFLKLFKLPLLDIYELEASVNELLRGSLLPV